MENVIDVANYIMATKGMTKGKVQIIMYYAYSIYLAEHNKVYSDKMNKLFEAEFEACKNIGPINRKIYDYINNFSNVDKSCIEKNEIKFHDVKNKVFLDRIIKEYSKYSVHELKRMVKLGEPWYHACIYPRLYSTIPSYMIKDKDIYDYFCKVKV